MSDHKDVVVRLPISIVNWIKAMDVPLSSYIRNLLIEKRRDSQFTKIKPNDHRLRVSEIDLDTNNIEIEISSELRELLGTKKKKVVVKL